MRTIVGRYISYNKTMGFSGEVVTVNVIAFSLFNFLTGKGHIRLVHVISGRELGVRRVVHKPSIPLMHSQYMMFV